MRKPPEKRDLVTAWQQEGVRVELLDLSPRPITLPRHAHAEYEIGVGQGGVWSYEQGNTAYRHGAPALIVHEAGESHSANTVELSAFREQYSVIYAQPSWVRQVAASITDGCEQLPVFSRPIVGDSDLARAFLTLHAGFRHGTSSLGHDWSVISFFTRLAVLAAEQPFVRKPAGKERHAVRLVREYLDHQVSARVTLSQLCEMTGLSGSYLVRSFTKEVGVPPHVYHLQRRLSQAKNLLLMGETAAHVAPALGFADQSHMTRLFRRYAIVTPVLYATKPEGNNVLDGLAVGR